MVLLGACRVDQYAHASGNVIGKLDRSACILLARLPKCFMILKVSSNHSMVFILNRTTVGSVKRVSTRCCNDLLARSWRISNCTHGSQ